MPVEWQRRLKSVEQLINVGPLFSSGFLPQMVGLGETPERH